MSDILVGPDTIFCGKVDMLNANIFKATASNGVLSGTNMTGTIKKAIAQTYVMLRNICALIMLAGLIFTGIRILVSSNNPAKQAHYKQYLIDWLIGLVLLIFSHILMYGIFYVSDTITLVLAKGMFGRGSLNSYLLLGCLGSWEAAGQIIYLLMLAYLIYLTVVFVFAYFKRLLWVCVLIVIAPIVAVMYSFGSATKQIYSKWLREYIMIVLVQPFHMIVYSILISIPLNLTNTGGGFQSSYNNIFTLIYALGAMSFIRPAEKYIRELFGMNQGLANMASFDSGKQTMDAIGKAVAAVAITAGTAGLGGAAVGALKAGKLAQGIGQIAGKAGGALSKTKFGSSKVGTKISEGLTNYAEDIFSHRKADKAAAINNEKPQEMLNSGESSSKDSVSKTYENDEFGKNTNGEYFNPSTDEKEKIYNPDYNPENTETETESSLEEVKDNGEGTTGNNINASNVTITAGSVSMQGGNIENNGGSEKTENDTTEKAKENLADEKEKIEEEKKGNNDGNIDIKSEGQAESDKELRKGTLLSNFMGVATGNQGLFETLGKETKGHQKLHSEATTLKNTEGDTVGAKFKRFTGKSLEGLSKLHPSSMMDSELGQSLNKFEQLGGMRKLHEGFNSVRDTFYAGTAPGDWKTTNARMQENQQEREEQQKFEFINKRENKEWLIIKYEQELRNQYPDEKKYPNARIHEMAIDKANSKLTSLSNTYVPLGITDSKLAYQCDQDRKEYGLTAKEAVAERINYERFNVNSSNITYLNDRYSTNVTNVADGIGDNTRDYYNNGYRNVEDMALVRDLTQALNVSTERGMQLDQVLRRKGGQIDYQKANLTEQQKAILKPIMDQYKEIQKGKK